MTTPVKQTPENAKIGAGKPGPGRKPGVPNKTTTMLKEAILSAAHAVGEDDHGKDGLEGYLKRVAKDDMKAFTGLLGKVLPMQVTGEDGNAIHVTIETGVPR